MAVLPLLFLLASCGTTKGLAYEKMYDEKPLIMLVMPPINNSTAADAKDYFYTTMNAPIAEHGYYVLPPLSTMAVMQRESAYDSELFIDGDLSRFKTLFNADVAVFTIIKSWTKALTAVIVNIEYIFKSTTSNEILFHHDAIITVDHSNTNSLIGIMAALLSTALTDYITVARMCNNTALADLPYGKYHPMFDSDSGEAANPKKISRRVTY